MKYTITNTLIGASSVQQVGVNVAASANVSFTDEEIKHINALVPICARFSGS